MGNGGSTAARSAPRLHRPRPNLGRFRRIRGRLLQGAGPRPAGPRRQQPGSARRLPDRHHGPGRGGIRRCRLPGGRLAWKYDKALRTQAREGRRDMPDLWPDLARIVCPALIVRGIESDVLSPQIAKRMLEILPGGRLIEIPDAGHTVPGDQPEAFLKAVRPFLES